MLKFCLGIENLYFIYSLSVLNSLLFKVSTLLINVADNKYYLLSLIIYNSYFSIKSEFCYMICRYHQNIIVEGKNLTLKIKENYII